MTTAERFQSILQDAEFAFKVATNTTTIPVESDYKLHILRGAALLIERQVRELDKEITALIDAQTESEEVA